MPTLEELLADGYTVADAPAMAAESPQMQDSEPSLPLRAASGFLKGVRGLGDLGEIVARVPEAIFMPGQKDIFRPLEAGNSLNSLFKLATGNEDPTNIGDGTFAHTAASYVPGLVLGPANVVKNAIQTGAQAVGAGIGQEVAGDAGEIIGGLGATGAASLFRGGAKAIGPQSEDSAKIVVGEMAKRLGISEDQVVAALKAQRGNSLGAIKSSAEVLKSPELSILEQQIASGGGAEAGGLALKYGKASAERIGDNGAYQKVLSAVSPARESVKEVGGQTIFDSFDKIKKAAGQKVTELYDAIPKDVKAPIMNLKRAITVNAKEFYGPGTTTGIPDELQKTIAYIKNPANKSRLTIQELQNLRKSVNDFIKTSTKPGTTAEAFATSIKNALKQTIENAPKGSKDWARANNAYAEYASIFKGGSLGKFFGSRERIASKVANKIIESPESAKQFDSIFQGNRPIMQVVKDNIASEVGKLIKEGKLSTARNFIENNKSQLKSLLRDDFLYLDNISEAILSSGKVKQMANAAGGSPTGLRLSNVIQSALTGKSTAASPGFWNRAFQIGGIGAGVAAHSNPLTALALAASGVGIGALRGRSNEVVGKALFRSLMEPNYLKGAINAATKDSAKLSKGLFAIGPQSAVPFMNASED